jgi:pyruvate/2-oxoglutarate dehydrogenase complex dihydrolipoamide dehydrogenase (E3) component
MSDPITQPLAPPPPARHVDAIIIGTGQAAPALANRLSQAGLTVAVIERGAVGGTCVNVGCTPTKTMVASAYVARMAARAAEYGVRLAGPASVDMVAVRARVDAVVRASRDGLVDWIAGMPGVELIRGHARFEGARRVRVGAQLLTADKVFINVGARASIPPLRGIGDVPCLTSSDMVAMDTLPRHLVIVGGSYIGLEFAQVFRRFGAEVTVVERGPRLIAREDPEVSAEILAILEHEGIRVRLDANCIGMRPHADGVAVDVDCASDAEPSIGSHLLIAVGRRPNTDDLGLGLGGVAVNEAGFIVVDEQLRTSAEGVWALGDCNGQGAFTHTAYNDFEIVAANVLDGAARSVHARIPVYGLFIDPPLGRVGMTVAQARASGRRVGVGLRTMARVGRAREKGETQGSMRVVVDLDDGQILGAAILGPGGDEAVHQVLAAMAAGTPYTEAATLMAIHPTVAELIPTIFGEVKPLA